MTKIAIIGIGYVGLANAILLSTRYQVSVYDIDANKLDYVRRRDFAELDDFRELGLDVHSLNIQISLSLADACEGADFVIISTPTDFSEHLGRFDTSSVEESIRETRRVAPVASIVIKSTVYVGFTDQMKTRFDTESLIYSPEFLRENSAIRDVFRPDRIVIGSKSKEGEILGELLNNLPNMNNYPTLFTDSKEAEAIKLFSNFYLALRVSFFNELDTFSEINGIDPRTIIDGVCSDHRIGRLYNNPSFGFGGYCLPKDTRQLLANFGGVEHTLVSAVIQSNERRKRFIIEQIVKKKPKKIGIYSNRFNYQSRYNRFSIIYDIIHEFSSLLDNKDTLMIYDPTLKCDQYDGFVVVSDLETLKKECDVIIANRHSYELESVKSKVYSRDVFGVN